MFEDSDDLLAHIACSAVDVVFLDIEMPGKTGLQLAEEIHELNPMISAVFVTAYSQYAVEAFERNAIDYLLKPVSEERLKKTIDRICSSRKYSEQKSRKVMIQCFRRFEFRVDESILPMNGLMKAKELLAFLISKKGAESSWEQITEALWPGTDYEKAHNNLHVTTFRLRKWLAENGAARIFEARRNSYRIVPLEFSCDLFDLENALKDGDRKMIERLYLGEFLEEEGYEWAYPIQAEWALKMNQNLHR